MSRSASTDPSTTSTEKRVRERGNWQGVSLRPGEEVHTVVTPSALWPVLIWGVLTAGLAALPVWWWIKQNRWAITNQRVIQNIGVFNKKTVSVGYDRVTDVSVNRPFLSWLFRNGTVYINTAGGDQQEIRINCQPHPRETAAEIERYW